MEINLQTDGHQLTSQILYGPVQSRRYGQTLGINLLPSNHKFCSFNCIYCQFGFSKSPNLINVADFPSVTQIKSDLEYLLPIWINTKKIHNIVISGNGEPTLHPYFPQIIEFLLSIRNKLQTYVPIICFTNGDKLINAKIFAALNSLDECCVKIDANFQNIDLPHRHFKFKTTLNKMKDLKNLIVQSCFLTGRLSNIESQHIAQWIEWLKIAQPRRVDLYTISRQTAAAGIVPVNLKSLIQIADRLKKQKLSRVKVYCA